MADFGSSPSNIQPVRARKKMRKGTQSCTECRRRKTRCTFPTGESICFGCSARGSLCIDQREEINTPETGDAMRVRKPVVRLESLHQHTSTVPTRNSTPQSHSVTSAPTIAAPLDVETPESGPDHRPPIVSALGNSRVPWPTGSTSGHSIGTRAAPTPSIPISFSAAPRDRGYSRSTQSYSDFTSMSQQYRLRESGAESICQSLRSALPGYDTIMSTLSENGGWWFSFRQKTHAISQMPVDDLCTFAMRTYTSSNPAELGVLVAAYARSSKGNQDHLYALVDSLVVSNLKFGATLEGMECLILLAKSYSDIGQPRRAWLIWRKGLATAQLMGLYRRDLNSPRKEMIWWTVYHGDRFASMLLGLPYGFNDSHYGSVLEKMAQASVPLPHQFVLQCAFMGGKVIDRNVTPSKPSFAKAMELDEQMEAIAAPMPDSWWAIPDDVSSTDLQLDELRERLLQQFYFFHVRMYIHMPFIKPPPSSPYEVSSRACMEACRQMLRRFVLLRTNVQGACLFECKTSDFVGLTAAITLLLGLHTWSDRPSHHLEADHRLVAATVDIFRSLEHDQGCKIASQCRETLELLSRAPANGFQSVDSLFEPYRISIPYFGTVILEPKSRPAEQLPRSDVDMVSAREDQRMRVDNGYEIDFIGYNMLDSELGDTQDSEPTGFNFSMNDMSLDFDLDQDWGMFHEFHNGSIN